MPLFADFLVQEIFTFLLIFVRIGAAFTVMPGFGEIFISPRVRLVLALAISFVTMPMLGGYIPDMPDSIGMFVALIVKEALIGIFLGILVRTLTSAMHVAGTIMATQSGLANAQMFDFTMSGQTTAVSNTLSFSALVLVFAADLHHIMLTGIMDSYQLIPVNDLASTQDMAFTMATYLNKTFYIGLKLASPFIAMALITNSGAGVLSRLMPNFQVFFVLMAPQIWVAFFVLLIALPSMMLWYLSYMEDGLSNLLISF